MIWIIFAGVLFLIGVLFIIFNDCYDDGYFWGWTLAVAGGIALAIMIPTALQLPDNEKAFINDYNATKVLIESYEGNEYGNMVGLTEKIIRINSDIARNKAYCNSPWRGVWNSEKVGSLEPLTYKMGKQE